ncbi:MAG: amidohydrolase family protein [Chloroflexi bacterium]|nr:amidohydrolase family protein [Chloroflexota bacterium]
MPVGAISGTSPITQAEASDLPDAGRIDVHTHIVPPDVVNGRRRYSQADLWFGRLYRNERRVLATADDLRRSMCRAGLAASVTFGFAWRDPGLCRVNNDYVLEAAAASNPGSRQILPFCVVPPGDLDFAIAEMERCRALGAVGVGELFPQGQSWNLNDRSAVRSFMDTVRTLGLILTVHTSEPVGHAYPGKDSTTPSAIWSVIEAAEGEVPIILAHWGGGLAFYELMPEVQQQAQNVYYDSSASHLLYRPAIYRLMSQLAPGRVLFGSDYPLIRQTRAIRLAREAGLPANERAALLGGNARRLGLVDTSCQTVN